MIAREQQCCRCCFFFSSRRRHTRFDCDWSSDVCSSDLPALNASWSDDGVVLHKDINVGVAVSVDDGLIVPVVHQADRMSIAGLAKSVDDLARRARATKLTIADVQGATFTVNNPGTFGTILSYSIIAPPQAGILAMDAIAKRPVLVEGDAIAIRSMMNLCLRFDHRALD